MIGGLFGAETSDKIKCSRASCTTSADFGIKWRNPKIHAEDRVKVWLACQEHVDFLLSFLAARNFPVQKVTVEELSRSADG